MKGVVLAGGLGTRLNPITLVTNKHLIPVYDKPMIYYPIKTLTNAGVTDILVVVSGPHAGTFLPVLKNGEDMGCKITYAYQSKPDGGIADALALAQSFAAGNNICVILGDNTTDANILKEVQMFESAMFLDGGEPRAHIFLKEVEDPRGFGVVKFNGGEIEEIVEKPKIPPSNMAVTGLYIFDNAVFKFIKQCKPSGRGQLEITDVNNLYLNHGNLGWSEIKGFWQDAGTFENLFLANKFWEEQSHLAKRLDEQELDYPHQQMQESFCVNGTAKRSVKS